MIAESKRVSNGVFWCFFSWVFFRSVPGVLCLIPSLHGFSLISSHVLLAFPSCFNLPSIIATTCRHHRFTTSHAHIHTYNHSHSHSLPHILIRSLFLSTRLLLGIEHYSIFAFDIVLLSSFPPLLFLPLIKLFHSVFLFSAYGWGLD